MTAINRMINTVASATKRQKATVSSLSSRWVTLFVSDPTSSSQDLQPLSLTFDLPVSLVPQTLPDAGSPLIQQVAQTLGVSVSFKAVPPHPQAQPAFYESCCTVWGLQGNAAAVKVAVRHGHLQFMHLKKQGLGFSSVLCHPLAESNLHPDGASPGVRGHSEQPAGRHVPAASLPAGAEWSSLPERHAPDPDPDHGTRPQRSPEPALTTHPGQP